MGGMTPRAKGAASRCETPRLHGSHSQRLPMCRGERVQGGAGLEGMGVGYSGRKCEAPSQEVVLMQEL